MARIRSIKVDQFLDDGLTEVSLEAHFLLLGLPCLADSAGRLEDRPRKIQALLFAYRPEVKVDALLSELVRSGHVVRYEADGGRYLQIENGETDQRPHIKEAESAIPPAPGMSLRPQKKRLVFAKPEALAWNSAHPGVPMPRPEGVDLPFPEIRLRTPAEQAAYLAEEDKRMAPIRAERAEKLRFRSRRWVYFMQERGNPAAPIKIGISRDVERRRGELQRAERVILTCLASFEGTIRDEAEMHARFAAHRLHGEWFAPAPEILSHVAVLNGRKE